MPQPDTALLERWTRDRNAEAFRELVDRHAAMVYSTARRLLGDPARAEDVTQDCFLKLVEAPAPTANFTAWLHRVAANRSLDVLRAEKRRRANEARWTPAEGAAAGASWEDVEPLVDEAIDRLPEELRSPIVLHFLESRSHEEVASALGISKSTVSYRIGKGIEGIRSFLKRRGALAAPAALAGWLSTQTAGAAPPALIASLGKLALAGPRSPSTVEGEPEKKPRRSGPPAAVPSPALSTSLLFLGGTMKFYLSIAAGILLLGACLFFLLRPGDQGAPPREVAGPPAKVPGPQASREEKPAPAEVAAPAPPAEPAAEKKEAPLAALSGKVIDEQGFPISGAQVLLAQHPAVVEDRLGGDRLKADWLRRSMCLITSTDAAGAFVFEGIAPRRVTISAFQEGRAGDLKEVIVEAGKAPDPVELKLGASGKTVRGVVVGQDGGPVTDAVVSIYHSWNPKDMAWGSSFALTDERGRFAIGLNPKAEMCDLRVNSESHGQDFFIDLAVSGEELRLAMKERASLKGRIAWDDDRPAAGVVVSVAAEVPEPRIPIWYSGWRPTMGGEAAVDAEGNYEITGLQPEFEYEAVVLKAGGDRLKARMNPLSPRGKVRFRLSPGEVKTWDTSIARPIAAHGTVRTAKSGTAVARARIGLKKDGKVIQEVYAESDKDGMFQLGINTGPGRYLFYARPRYAEWDDAAEAIAREFGKEADLEEGADAELDLLVFEPITLPIRVLDADGSPVTSIRYQLEFKTEDGKRHGCGDSTGLGADGRTTISLCFPVAEMSLAVAAFTGGPMTEPRPFRPSTGMLLGEETFVLARTCAVSMVLLAPDGAPLADTNLTADITYGDGQKETIGIRTDSKGAFSHQGLRAAAMTIRIHGAEGGVKVEGVDGSTSDLDLGTLTLDPRRADKPKEAADDGKSAARKR